MDEIRTTSNIADKAMEAFWAAVAAEIPEATTGDMDPAEANAFRIAAHSAIGAWRLWNDPGFDADGDR